MNLWTIKTVLRSFEIVSGLKVNFFKSKLYGKNLEELSEILYDEKEDIKRKVAQIVTTYKYGERI